MSDLIVGVDEVGTGCIAGPVFAAACAFSEGFINPGVKDSKALSPKRRDKLYEVLSEKAMWALGIGSLEEIDANGIRHATQSAMRRAISRFGEKYGLPSIVLVDGDKPISGLSLPQKTIVKGDATVPEISAASILAKVLRDRTMEALGEMYPHYLFEKHKGYGTAEHYEALKKFGPSPAHRRNFAPVAELLKEKNNG